MRHYADTTLLIAVNFGDQPAQLEINIPQLALDMYGITPGDKLATELLTKRKATLNVSSAEPFKTDIEAFGAVIWKFKR
jgi:hypothetical protein